MTFTWLNKQGVKSSKGFVVQTTGRFTMEYIENIRKITIGTDDGELPNGKFCDIVDAESVSKWDDGTSIPKEKQAEILQNLKEAMEFQGMGLIVEVGRKLNQRISITVTDLDNPGAKSDKDFVVQRLGPAAIEYMQNLKKITIATQERELPNGELSIIIGENSVSKWDDGTPISKEKQTVILRNLEDALMLQSLMLVVECDAN